MNSVVGLFKAMRPRQWVKNLLVFLPLLFAVDLVWSPTDLTTLLAYAPRLAALFAAFCALSSAVYIINDLADREADRQHPTKRFRPIASGRILPVPLAAAAQFVLIVGGMFGLYAISEPPLVPLAVIGAVYLLVNVGLLTAAQADSAGGRDAGGRGLRDARGSRSGGRRRDAIPVALRGDGCRRAVHRDRPEVR